MIFRHLVLNVQENIRVNKNSILLVGKILQSSILTKVHIYEAVVCQFCDNARYIGQYSLCQDGGMALCPGREPTGSLARPCGHMDLEIPFGCLPYYTCI